MLKNGNGRFRSAEPEMKPHVSKQHQEDISTIFGKNVKTRRNDIKFSREYLAELADVSVDVIKRVEKGMGCKLEAACHIADALGVPLQSLLPSPKSQETDLIMKMRFLLDELENRIN